MSTFTFFSAFMEHTGGTKFYQLFHIYRNATNEEISRVTVAHYGPLKNFSKNALFNRPIVGGQVKVHQDVSGSKYNDLLEEKKSLRNGGKYVPTGGAPRQDFSSESEFRIWLGHNFPTRARNHVLSLLDMHIDPDATPISDEDQPIAELETINSAPKEVPIGWGDW